MNKWKLSPTLCIFNGDYQAKITTDDIILKIFVTISATDIFTPIINTQNKTDIIIHTGVISS